MHKFSSSLQKFSSSLDRVMSHGIDISNVEDNIADFSQKKKAYQSAFFKTSFNELLNSSSSLAGLEKENSAELINGILLKMNELKKAFEGKNLEEMGKVTDALATMAADLRYPVEKTVLSFKIGNIPMEIAAEMNSDLNELERCFKAGCYKASVILCGRLLEAALHRVYYEKTENDLLEKAPGIGLGNLIAKIKDRGISLDPAISQQIHLINQVRIYSVHKKKESFNPGEGQTHAIILYTIDVIKNLFS